MKTIRFSALIISICLALINPAHAQNLLANGDFEGGVLTPWTATGDVQVTSGILALYGVHSCGMGLNASGTHTARIEQTVATTAGTLYYLALDIVAFDPNSSSDFTLGAAPAAGGAADGSVVFQVSSSTAHRTLIFHASTASTKIAIDMSGAECIVDNIQLIALPPNKHAGKYTGTAQTILGSEESGVTNKETARLVARITPTGQIVILEGATQFDAGTLLPDGTLDIRLHGIRRVFTTSIRGSRIQFTLNGSPNLFDEGGNELDAVMRTIYTLTRVR